jgi:hypothetical protein
VGSSGLADSRKSGPGSSGLEMGPSSLEVGPSGLEMSPSGPEMSPSGTPSKPSRVCSGHFCVFHDCCRIQVNLPSDLFVFFPTAERGDEREHDKPGPSGPDGAIGPLGPEVRSSEAQKWAHRAQREVRRESTMNRALQAAMCKARRAQK